MGFYTGRKSTCRAGSWAGWAAGPETRRVVYFFVGERVLMAGREVAGHGAIEVVAKRPLDLVNTGPSRAELLVLQGRPIGEPVAQYGPFVMNTEQEIRQAIADYQGGRMGRIARRA